MSGVGHPSGLRDAIADGLHSVDLGHDEHGYVTGRFSALLEAVEQSLVAWLSVVSEGEREAATNAFCAVHPQIKPAGWGFRMRAALAASRGVLLPKETPGSSYSVGSPSMKEHP